MTDRSETSTPRTTPRTWPAAWTDLDPPAQIVAGGAAAIAALIGLHGVNSLLLGDGAALALDREGSLATWASSSLFLLAAIAWIAAGGLRPATWAMPALSAVALAMSADETVQLHERGEREAGADLSLNVVQPLLALVVVALILLASRRAGETARRHGIAAACALVLGQLASMAGAPLEDRHAVYVALSVAEESLELLTGVFLLSAGVAARLAR